MCVCCPPRPMEMLVRPRSSRLSWNYEGAKFIADTFGLSIGAPSSPTAGRRPPKEFCWRALSLRAVGRGQRRCGSRSVDNAADFPNAREETLGRGSRPASRNPAPCDYRTRGSICGVRSYRTAGRLRDRGTQSWCSPFLDMHEGPLRCVPSCIRPVFWEFFCRVPS
jgi:hypothetical protein